MQGNKNALKPGYARLMRVRVPSQDVYQWLVENTTAEQRGQLLAVLFELLGGEWGEDIGHTDLLIEKLTELFKKKGQFALSPISPGANGNKPMAEYIKENVC